MQDLNTINTLLEVKALLEERGTVFVRWSNGPAEDARYGWVSRNHQTGAVEPGLSVDTIHAHYSDHQILRAITQYRFIGGPVCYLLTGEINGKGSDREDTLTACTPLALVGTALSCTSIEDKHIVRLSGAVGCAQKRLVKVTDYYAIDSIQESIECNLAAIELLNDGASWSSVSRMYKDAHTAVIPRKPWGKQLGWRGIAAKIRDDINP